MHKGISGDVGGPSADGGIHLPGHGGTAPHRNEATMILCQMRWRGRNLFSAAIYRVHDRYRLVLWWGRNPVRSWAVTLEGPSRSHTGAGRWSW